MAESIVYLDRSTIRSDDLDGLRRAVTALVDFVRKEEPQLLLYGFEIDESRRSMSVVAVHPDSASLERHLGVGGPAFREVGAFIELRAIDVYGVPSQAALDGLRAKARLLGHDVPVQVHALSPGFNRLAAVRS